MQSYIPERKKRNDLHDRGELVSSTKTVNSIILFISNLVTTLSRCEQSALLHIPSLPPSGSIKALTEVMSDDKWAVHLLAFNLTVTNDSLPSTRASPEILKVIF